ncbi:MAG TPA: coproporphyrinogen dehydrogenase HemZ, partial [Lachnospiraceae bacterium]|nr:coproporphyrinogen dehydrogenase HemZ [Lachnospiraceae bacterium]
MRELIEIIVNRPGFAYDIHSLVKAFFPGKDVSVRVQEAFTKQTRLQMKVDFTDGLVHTVWLEEGQIKGEGTKEIDYTDRKETKNHLKRQIYGILSQYTGQSLPWGSLTGIRPTKIVMQMLEAGKSDTQIEEHMRTVYLTSREKAALSVRIANRERHILRDIDYQDGYSLYVGIPFCPSTCLYCSFTSYPLSKWEKQIDMYLDTLCKELDYVAETFRHKKLNTV